MPRLRELLRLPDLDLKVHKVSHWILDRIVADRWRVGDIFLAGDAAHRQPPTTGLGLNTGILDAHNLTWKLAQVLSGPRPTPCSTRTSPNANRSAPTARTGR